MHIYLFDDQHYAEQDTSPLFPTVPLKQLIPKYVERAWKDGSSVTLRALENDLQ